MPAHKAATLELDDLPAIMTVAELAAFERVDVRVTRRDLEAGEIAGAFRRGNSWRIARDSYLKSVGASHAEA